MKNPILLLLFVFGIINITNAQSVPGEKTVPAAVKAKFKTEYPNAVIKWWETKAVVKEYVAVFVDQNLQKRARYKADGKPVLLHIAYPAASVPTTYSSKITTEYTGFKVDWANEWNNFITGNHFVEVRLSKPGYILKVFVDTNGNVITDDKKTKEDLKAAGENVENDSTK